MYKKTTAVQLKVENLLGYSGGSDDRVRGAGTAKFHSELTVPTKGQALQAEHQ